MTWSQRFAALVREGREHQNLTQEQLASEAGLTRTVIANIESSNQRVSLEQALTLATLLEISLEDLKDEYRDELLRTDLSVLPKNIQAPVYEIMSNLRNRENNEAAGPICPTDGGETSKEI
jgi:transcriptional regulator with XRE-family HTH domain